MGKFSSTGVSGDTSGYRSTRSFMRFSGGKRVGGSSLDAGHTILEVLVAFIALSIGLLGFAQAIGSSISASQSSHRETTARQAAHQAMEQLATQDFATLFALYNDDPGDDPGVPGTAPGSNFAVEGLDVAYTDLDGFAGKILFPTSAGAPGVLREDVADGALGMPRDLNLDGNIDAADHSLDYLILPVVVQVEWRDGARRSQVMLRTIVGNYQ